MYTTRTPTTCAVMLLFLLLLAGCGAVSKQPIISDLRAEPTILPVELQTSATSIELSYTIMNHAEFQFNGKAKLLFDTDCLTVQNAERDITVDASEDIAFSSRVQARRGSRDIDEECYGEQEITVALYDGTGERLLDHKLITIRLAQR